MRGSFNSGSASPMTRRTDSFTLRIRSVMTLFKPVSVLGVDDEALGERDLPFLAAQPPLGLVEETLRLTVLARRAGDGDARELPHVVVVDLGDGSADAPLQ